MTLHEFVRQFGELEMQHLLTLRKNVFMTNAQMLETIARIEKLTHAAPLYAGELLGTEDKTFRAAPALLDHLADKTDKKVMIDEKSAYLFLCGRDVLAGSILQQDVRTNYQGQVLVLNEQHDVLGLGVMQRENRDGVVVRNLFDRGDFLRREGIKKKQQTPTDDENF